MDPMQYCMYFPDPARRSRERSMRVVCSYCRKYLPDKAPLDDEGTSHTICPECYDYFVEQLEGLPLDKYLDRFDAPVMIVDDDCRIVAANAKAADITGKPEREIVGKYGGNALECVYSRLPGGCGKTVHCETCAIRRAVQQALETGKPQMRIPVHIQREDGEVSLKFSVVKIGALIRIMIEE